MTALVDKIASRTVHQPHPTLPTPCHIWQGAVQSKGYPSVAIGNGKNASGHRIVLEAKLGRPLVFYALHRCDVKRCVNPDHLYEGTPAQNAQDAIDRDLTTKGTRNGRATINEEQARRIRFVLKHSACGVSDIADAMSIPRSVVCGIKRGMEGKRGGTWAWL